MSKCQCSKDFPEEPFAMLSGKRKRKRETKQNQASADCHSKEHCAAALRPRREKKDSPLAIQFTFYNFLTVFKLLTLPPSMEWRTTTFSRCAGFGFLCVSTPVSKDTTLAIPTTSARQSAVMYRKSAGGASSPSSLAPTKTLDVCW